MRAEFLTDRSFASLKVAQRELDAWVASYNDDRPHQSLDMDTPAVRFRTTTAGASSSVSASVSASESAGTAPVVRVLREIPDRTGPEWVARKVSTVGVVCVSWQQVSVGKHRAGERCDVHVGEKILQFWIGNELLRTVARASTGPVRNKRPLGGALTKTKRDS